MAFATLEEEFIATHYPGMLSLFRISPEVQLYLTAAAREQWSGEKTKAVIMNTDWWKSTPGPTREALNLEMTDPASWNIQVANRASLLYNEAAKLGWVLPSNVAHLYAGLGFRQGYTDAQIMARLVLDQAPDPKHAAGVLGEMFAKTKAAAGDWGITVGDNEASFVAKGAVAWGNGDEAISTFARNKALKQYASNTGLVDAIQNQGITVRDYAAPYIDMAAQELELNPGQIDFSHPSWQRLIHRQDEGGTWGAMPLQEAQKTLRTDPIWGAMHDKTIGARTEATEMVGQLAQTFGKAG